MTLVARHAALTDIGLHRTTNEDACAVRPPVYAVADGMGGAKAGEIASSMAVETFLQRIEAGDTVVAAARAANGAVFAEASADSERSGMGTTLTAISLGGASARVAHVGDSRLYRLRGGQLTQLTDDHSVVAEWMREGAITAEEAANSRYRHVLTRALGTDADIAVDEFETDLSAGDVLLLCTDGLYSMVPGEVIEALLAERDDPQACARRLVREAKNRGGHDNITVVVIAIEDESGEQGRPAAGEGPAGGQDTARLPVTAASPAFVLPSLMPGSGWAATRAARRRRATVAALVAALLLLAAVVAVMAAERMYFVGVDEATGTVAAYRGAPYELGGVKLYRLYQGSRTTIDGVGGDLRERVVSQRVTGKEAALALLGEATGPP